LVKAAGPYPSSVVDLANAHDPAVIDREVLDDPNGSETGYVHVIENHVFVVAGRRTNVGPYDGVERALAIIERQ
jgi:hypothetical protein